MMRQTIPSASFMANYHHQQHIVNYSEEASIIRQGYVCIYMGGKVCLRGREEGKEEIIFESTT